ncbi:MAG: hypothetical protein AAF628_37175 [Planctomycetota bacterium]
MRPVHIEHFLLALAWIPALCPAQEVQAYALALDRKIAAYALWDGSRTASCSVEYGAPSWHADHAAAIPKLRGRRVRFGKDTWAHLEVDTPITLGGVAVAPGAYCLALDCAEDGTWSLVLLNSAVLRRRGLPGFATQRVLGLGTRYPMAHTESAPLAHQFTVAFEGVGPSPADAQLRIAFGPHVLTAAVRFDPREMIAIDLPPQPTGGR